jgi:hypothetical protein
VYCRCELTAKIFDHIPTFGAYVRPIGLNNVVLMNLLHRDILQLCHHYYATTIMPVVDSLTSPSKNQNLPTTKLTRS